LDAITIGLLGFVLFLLFLFLGMPVSFSMMIVGVAGIALLRSPIAAYHSLSSNFVLNFTSYTMSVVPMFMLMGDIAIHSGLGDSLFNIFQKFLGHKRGGLAIAVNVVCAIFGAICGSLLATIAMMGNVAYPAMEKYGYDDKLATACIAAAGPLATIIPPSVTLIVYGIITENSIGQLFMGGILVGIVLVILNSLTITFWLKINPSLASVAPQASREEKIESLRKGGLIEIFIVFLIAMGGLFAGWFTPTEAGVVGIFGMLIVAIIFKRFSFNVIKNSCLSTITMAGMIYFLIAAAGIYGNFFALSGIPVKLGLTISEINLSPFMVIVLITLIYLILGMLIDGVVMMLLTIPIFYPIIENLGFSGIWFGVYIVIIVAMGAMTPPVGMSCYVLQGLLQKVPLNTIFSGVWPFIGALVVLIVLITVFPQIVTWLPALIYSV
jgi:tripartite ATP-independent transporter DctM subunit